MEVIDLDMPVCMLNTYLMMSHIRFCAIQQSLEFQSIRISIRNHISNLADNCSKYKNTYQVTDYRKNVSENERFSINFSVQLFGIKNRQQFVEVTRDGKAQQLQQSNYTQKSIERKK